MKVKLTKVLVIEDDPLYLKTLKDSLAADRGLFEVEAAGCLESGCGRLSAGGIDLVLLALSMPDSGGIAAVRKICLQAPHVPVVVLASCEDEEIALQALQAGAQDYLVTGRLDRHLLRRAMRYALERRRRDLALHESQTRLQLIADSTPEIIALFDLIERRLVYVNRQVNNILGYSPEQLQQMRLLSLVHADDLARLADGFRLVQTMELGEVLEVTYRVRNANQEWRWLHSEITLFVRDEEGRIRQALITTHDVTERKQTEEKLRELEAQFLRMQRLESIGALASGIAHDLNNWLAPVMLALHTLQQRFTDANSQKWLSIIRKSAERSRDLIDQVLTFAKGAAGERLPLGTSNLLADAAKIVGEIVPRNISLEVAVAQDLWSIVGDATQIHQVMMNLGINARDAMPDGGKLIIAASNTVLTGDEVWMAGSVKPGRFVRITVTDSGVGMTPELIDRAFEPFFTTKENGLGSGLGLSTVLGIVRSHGGFINVTSSVGKGSQFSVYLPASESEPETFLEEKLESLPAGDGQLVLVVDDEVEMREVTRATLESSGYRTLGAEDGREALSVYDQYEDEIRLVLTSLTMPQVDGISLGQALRGMNPQLKIIVTGCLYSQEQIEAAKRAGIQTLLSKPFTAQELLSAMAKNLN